MYQQVIIIGNLGKDPEITYTQQGVAVCKFNVATSEKWGSGDQRKEETTWWRVTTWKEKAEAAAKGLHKGSKVMVIGRVKVNAYLDKNNQPQASLELNASEFKFLDPKPQGNEQGNEDSNSMPF